MRDDLLASEGGRTRTVVRLYPLRVPVYACQPRVAEAVCVGDHVVATRLPSVSPFGVQHLDGRYMATRPSFCTDT